MIKAVTPIRFPATTEDAVDTLVVGEFRLTDTGRLLIGPSADHGNMAFDREHFPLDNIEVLTEASPRTREVINQYARNENRHSYFIPTVVRPNSGWEDLRVASYDGGYAYPLEIDGPAASVRIDFHAFVNNMPVSSGTIRALCSPTGVVQNTLPASAISLRVVAAHGDFVVQANNTGADIVTLLISKTVVSTARKPDPRSPIWTTANGSIGDFPNAGVAVSIQLLATDPNGEVISYSLASGALPPGLSLSGDGLISGTVTQNGTFVFTARAANQTFYTDREFSIHIAVPNLPAVWQTAANLGTKQKGALSIQLTATDPESHAVNYVLVSGDLPAGLLLSASGLITGTTTAAGAYTFTVGALDGVHTVERTFTLTVLDNAPPVWVSPAGSIGSYLNGTDINVVLTATDPEGSAVVYNVDNGLPPSLNLDGLTGGVARITGNVGFVVSSTTYTFTVNAIDTLGNQNPRVFTITVHP